MGQFVGILGGMGTEATTHFYNKLMELDVANNDQEHLKVILYNNSEIPDRTTHILKQGKSPLAELVTSAKMLEATGVDFIVLPCNTAHYFYNEIKCSLNIPILNIISEIALYLMRKKINGQRIGLLATTGTIVADVYKEVFKEYNLDITYPSKSEQGIINDFIYRIKMNKDLELKKFNHTLEEFFLVNNLDAVVLGCTEFTLIKNQLNFGTCDVIDSSDLLARRTYVYAKCIEDIKQSYK